MKLMNPSPSPAAYVPAVPAGTAESGQGRVAVVLLLQVRGAAPPPDDGNEKKTANGSAVKGDIERPPRELRS